MEVSYKIIGGDGREYGPASLEELKGWVADGRVGAMTNVWRSDTERWAPAAHQVELQPQLGPPVTTAPSISAGFWPRCAAYFLDMAILMTFFSLAWVPLAAHYGWKADLTFQDIYPRLAVPRVELASFFLLSHLIRAIYDTLLNGRFGATVGKMALGLRITRLDGSSIGYRLAFARWLACRLSELALYTGYLVVLVRHDKRALHDLLAGTKVVFRR
jgi:uncharacterized RDD family membrane protein YckC